MIEPITSSRAPSLVAIVQWAWLVGLSILVIAGWRSSIAVEDPQAAATQQNQAIEARIVILEESNQARLVQAPLATQQALQSLRESLEARLDRLESQASSEGAGSGLEAQRTEIEQLKTQMIALKASLAERAAPRKVVRPAPTLRPISPREEPPPFRVLGIEQRAGRLSVSVAPVEGALAANAIQVVLPGESLGKWRLEAVERNTAVFRAGEQIRRLAIP
ncbi:hypothetical protein [Pseudomonas chlororaphis]|uniref:hypothetical protein n=1 Tax=Pseudomonas chlororaphis TaxID=587753 RepID=UPI000470F2AF|nr:hypothetical protein [Pseudomonas chlororaphis]